MRFFMRIFYRFQSQQQPCQLFFIYLHRFLHIFRPSLSHLSRISLSFFLSCCKTETIYANDILFPILRLSPIACIPFLSPCFPDINIFYRLFLCRSFQYLHYLWQLLYLTHDFISLIFDDGRVCFLIPIVGLCLFLSSV